MFGVNNLDHPSPFLQTRLVRTIIPHPRYSRAVVDYDISIVELSEDVNETSYVRPVCLPSSEEALQPDTYCYITGWGHMGNKSKSGASGGSTCLPFVPENHCVTSQAWATVSRFHFRKCSHKGQGVGVCVTLLSHTQYPHLPPRGSLKTPSPHLGFSLRVSPSLPMLWSRPAREGLSVILLQTFSSSNAHLQAELLGASLERLGYSSPAVKLHAPCIMIWSCQHL